MPPEARGCRHIPVSDQPCALGGLQGLRSQQEADQLPRSKARAPLFAAEMPWDSSKVTGAAVILAAHEIRLFSAIKETPSSASLY